MEDILKPITIPVNTNLDELKGYVKQLIEVIEKIEKFELTANFGEVVEPVH